MTNKLQIFIRRDLYKFSSAHMTVFPDGSKEAIHGHNFQVELKMEVTSCELKDMIPFQDLKQELRELTSSLNEKLLIGTNCPHFKLVSKASQIEFTLCDKKYSLPSDEVLLLPLDNISSESLAFYLTEQMTKRLKPKQFMKTVRSITMRVEENPGQGAEYTITNS